MKAKVVWAAVIIAVASQFVALVGWGFSVYAWVQGLEALGAAIAIAFFGVRYWRRDPRASRWPPLLPLSTIASAGALKDFFAAADLQPPLWVVAALVAAVGWFLIASFWIWRAEAKPR